ncbi:hypothetical protein [Streptomyces afghaniensis]|uniref:hypothetical protein n=1 Tax=Streptomyces afghaniensis TaxID=66865 RepID=UPI002780E095|nr:hypothetical protein [Streptomyces afghaniensis]MDQ1013601.1 hypothetical protein [Streptomyces afghaniensis]
MSDLDDERFHLTLTAGGLPLMHGWWGKRPTAEHQYRSWIGSWGSVGGARIVLTERVSHGEQVLASWPEGS